MIKFQKQSWAGLGGFFVLWTTQSLSGLGSAMTSFALIVWSYQQEGSALSTALLSICSYAPYVLMSIFAGALSDKWDKRRTMLLSDAFAALSTLAVLILLKTGALRIWHLYLINAFSGLMNTVQEPASSVSVSLLVPEGQYQRVAGLRSLSNALITVLTPVLASAVLAFAGLDAVIFIDLLTCAVGLVALGFFVRLPRGEEAPGPRASVLESARSGLSYLWKNPGILDLMLFLAAINLVASMFNAALPAMLLSRSNGGETALGLVNASCGLATLAGSLFVSLRPAPKSRVRVICNALLFSMSTENLILALGRTVPAWCVASVLGWLFIPVMNANMEALFRSYIPINMQGRVYSARNALQFFTIPLGYLLGGALVDGVLEPYMATLSPTHFLARLLGDGKGSGAALLFLLIAGVGVAICLIFRRDARIWALERT